VVPESTVTILQSRNLLLKALMARVLDVKAPKRESSMGLTYLLLVGMTTFVSLLMVFHYVHLPSVPGYEGVGVPDAHKRRMEGLVRLVSEQNRTINTLMSTLSLHQTKALTSVVELNPIRPSPNQGATHASPPPPSPHLSQSLASITSPTSDMEDDCDRRYGTALVELWAQAGQEWCGTGHAMTDVSPSITCYPYAQQHKGGRTKDMFCEARNIVVDFSKIHGAPQKKKIRNGDNYLGFSTGALQSECRKTSAWHPELFMPHQQKLFRTFRDGTGGVPVTPVQEVTQTMYFLQRDEDCENAFHSTADFMNMFLVMSALGIKPEQQQVMLFDRHIDGPYLELLQKAYSPKHDVIRPSHYGGKVVKFKRTVFHLESPAGLIFPKVSGATPLRCRSTGLFEGYRKFVLDAFGLYNVAPPPIPHVVLTLRERTQEKNVGRIMANEADVKDILEQGNLMKLSVVDQAKMSYGDQLRLMRSANVLVGVHGAGLMFIMFAAEEAVLVEIHPSYRQDRHFRHAARMTGKLYMPVRSLDRESCHGSSDNVKVPKKDFTLAMDGALRAARSFDDGLSECGLRCPGQILAIDRGLDRFYDGSKGESRVAPVNLRFPC